MKPRHTTDAIVAKRGSELVGAIKGLSLSLP